MIPTTSRSIACVILLALGLLGLAAPCAAEVAMSVVVRVVPVVPSAPVLAAASDSGVSNSDRVTSVTSPTVTGTTSLDAVVSIYAGGIVVGTAAADAFGNYSVVIGPLAAGTHVLTAIAAYEIGFSAPSAPTTIQIVPATTPVASFTSTSQRVSEAAGAATATVSLSAASDLTVQVPFTLGGTANNPSDYTTAAASPLVLAPGATTAVLSFTVVDDGIIETTETITITMGVPINATAGSDSLHTLSINDNDTAAAVVITPATPLTVSESGTSAAFYVSLAAVPNGNISVTLTNPSSTSLSLSTAALTFTPSNFDVVQTVLVTGVSDSVVDGNQTYFVQLGPIAAGTNYAGISGTPVEVRVLDVDVPGLVISESSSSTAVTENGAIDSYTVALATQPAGTVTVTLSPDVRLLLNSTTLSFTTGNWNTPQTISVSVIDDLLVQGNRNVFIIHSASGGGYGGLSPQVLTVAITDNDSASLQLTPTSVTVSESGSTAQVNVNLASQPSSSVSVSVSSSDTAVGTVSPAALTFTPSNWSTLQTITVTGVDDGNVLSGNRLFSVNLLASGDAAYVGLTASAAGLCLDNDGKNLVLGGGGSLQVTEGSATPATYTVRLSQAPTAAVSVTLTNPDGYVLLSPSALTFTTGNWATTQTVTVTAVNDAIAQGTHQGTINHAWTSADPGYVSSVSLSLVVVVNDNDTASIVNAPTSGLETTEIGGSDTFTVVLTSQPTSDVTLAVVSGDTAQATVNPASLTFTSSTWNVAQTVTVTGADGNGQHDGDVAFTILVGPAVSSDPVYSGRSGGSVTGVNRAVDNPPTLAAPISATVASVLTPLVLSGADLVLVVNEDPGSIVVALTGISNGQTGETQAMTVTAVSDTPALTGSLSVSYTNPQTTGLITFTPVLYQNGTAWITVTASDGGANPPATQRFKLQVNSVDTSPIVVRTTDAIVAYNGVVPITGLQASSVAPGQLACSDVETPAATLAIVLSVAPQKGVLQRWNALSGTWVVIGLGDSFTQEDVNLGLMRYVHTDSSAALVDGFQFNVRDSINQTAGGAINLSVDPNKPSVSLLPASHASFSEGDPDTVVAPQGVLFNPVASLSAGTLEMTAAGGDAGDTLLIQAGGNISLSGGTVSYGATAIGTVSSGANLVVTFNASATTAMAEELLRQVVFRNTSDNPSAAQRTISAVLTNSLGFSSTSATITLAVIPINDPPVASALALVAADGVPVTVTPAISDPDGPAITVATLTAPAKGDLVINNAATGAFTYTPWPSQSGPDSFVLTVSDGATPTAGTTTISVSVAISGPATLVKPWIDSRPPMEAQAGDLLLWTMHVDTTDLLIPTLSFSTIGAPAGLLVVPDLANNSAALSWTVPPITARGEVSFTVLVSDSVSQSAAAQVVTIFVHELPGASQ